MPQFGISQVTFYNWKKYYGGLGVSGFRRPKQLEAENMKSKKLVADLSLDKEMLQVFYRVTFPEKALRGYGLIAKGSGRLDILL